MTDRNPRRDRPCNDIEESHAIRDHDSNMPPLIGQQLRDRERRQLTVPCPESNQNMRHDGLADVVGRGSHDSPNEDQNVAQEDEGSPAEEITVSSADHEGDGCGGDVDGRNPVRYWLVMRIARIAQTR